MKILFNTAKAVLPDGFYFRVRYGLISSELSPLALGFGKGLPPRIPTKDQRIVIVGGGFAGVHFACQLKQKGYSQVTVVNRDDRWGGKCVYDGCMPSELFYSQMARGLAATSEDFDEMSRRLSGYLAANLAQHGVTVIKAEAEAINDRHLLLGDGAELPFDALVLATGNFYPSAARYPGQVSYFDFWRLQAGHLVIRSTNNPNMLGLAEAAVQKGLKTTLVYEKKIALGHLPVIKHLLSKIRDKNLQIIVAAGETAISSTEQTLTFPQSKQPDIPYHYLLSDTDLRPRFLAIDGAEPAFEDIRCDFFSHKKRPDIFFVGDAAGMLSVTEGEWQADLLLASWLDGKPCELSGLEAMPLRLHGKTPVGIVGAPHTLLSSRWQQVDFRQLGYSLVHQQEGMLWYQWDRETKAITAFQIYHPMANELVAIAQLLMGVPVTDSRWQLPFVHPSAGEIFKVVRQQVCQEAGLVAALKPSEVPLPQQERWALPAWEALKNLLSSEEQRIAELTPQPDVYLRLLYGIKRSRGLGADTTLGIKPQADGTYRWPAAASFHYDTDPQTAALTLNYDQTEITVF